MHNPCASFRGAHISRRLLAVLLCGAALLVRFRFPQTARAMETWLIGPQDNQVIQAFAELEYALERGDGLGQAVQVFYGEMTGDAPS